MDIDNLETEAEASHRLFNGGLITERKEGVGKFGYQRDSGLHEVIAAEVLGAVDAKQGLRTSGPQRNGERNRNDAHRDRSQIEQHGGDLQERSTDGVSGHDREYQKPVARSVIRNGGRGFWGGLRQYSDSAQELHPVSEGPVSCDVASGTG